MKRVIILGAAGQIAKLVEPMLLTQHDVRLTLFLRHPEKLTDSALDKKRIKIITGDCTHYTELVAALADQDIVYANLAGKDIETQAETVVKAMRAQGLRRLIWISTLGIYDEVPGEFGQWNRDMLGGYLEAYSAAAAIIEHSVLDYTLIRPAWLQDKDEVNYEITSKKEPFKGTEVSRKSVAALVASLVADPTAYVRQSIGIDKPGTTGARPLWYAK
ncbi:SDR family oxidoreductase [Liquorilactobacillus satsumensis]|uniref:Saccharopine dehydrogenase related protein n=1 Tax=Liquorilactobacillus satsumensis DSM 16230 = JCM 12392 TaxID=1423801 RepID=A0A0R1V2P9_9LACO|nr:SDR family oxidoreductase [Liquorilactobacillus satsumensis]KRL99428.1 saccharopine dehydrogenase related protein [Liquorilactobacillus satsumensis DSM 16230 = JCM 12392]MCC7665904.1 NAD-dependent dehydratase [Liquorilactobacillus satsumensis]MCP9312136.1 SDR family oxidoreductase [Liquorilactobacillus satsumensis]MCP9359414.1 SDR family oxidoreductase [Liquorilactobacillus satsumensis]